MYMQSSLEFVLMMLGTAVIGVLLFRKFRLPSILGYLAVGVVIGPYATGLVSDAAPLQGLAEFGVVFLMFTVGLEFSFKRLMAMRNIVFGLGFAQVTASVVVAIHISALIVFIIPELGMSWQAAFALGGAWALSSTAIVTKMLADRMELETEYGRRVLGILLFQDIAIVILLMVVPALGSDPGSLWIDIGLTLAKVVFALGILLLIGEQVMNRWMGIVARTGSQELFMLNLLLLTLGAAWLTDTIGLSLELGAFLAGMLVAETRYRHEVETNIKSFRDVLLGLYFITIGMMLNLWLVRDRWWVILIMVVCAFIFQFGVTAIVTRFFGASKGVSLKVALVLSQASEFSFVLVNQVGSYNMIEPWLYQATMASMVVSMLMAPFIIMNADRIVSRFAVDEWMKRSVELTKIASQTMTMQKHAIICGFGKTGQAVARLLAEEGIPYRALDLDPERVKRAEIAGEKVSYADSTRREALVAAGIDRASSIIITLERHDMAMRVLHYAKTVAPDVPVIVRCSDENDFEAFRKAGADEVVPEVLECSLVLASNAMVAAGVSMKQVLRRVRASRMSRYANLREYFHGDDEAALLESASRYLHAVRVPDNSPVIGQLSQEFPFLEPNVDVVSVVRGGNKIAPDVAGKIVAGDVLVLRGDHTGMVGVERRIFGLDKPVDTVV
jgi:CPA2 family monovalent cation:H+ antiporter-2